MLFIQSRAVADQLNQHHLGVPFCGGVSLAPVPNSKAQSFVGTVDADAKLLTASAAEGHLISVIDTAIECRSLVARHLSDASVASKAFLADLKKLTKDGAAAPSVIAQAEAYACDLAAALAFDTDVLELRSVRFLASHLDYAAFDTSGLRAKLTELADLEASIHAGQSGLRDALTKIASIKAEAAAKADSGSSGNVIAPAVFKELATLRAAAAAILKQIDNINRQIGAAA